jgi:endonuclease/exonuclease/phosphatase family metal-dependent hydrolase
VLSYVVQVDDRLSVLTCNVYSPANPDWDRRVRLLSRVFHRLSPDVVALQEVPVDRQDILDELLGPGYHFSHFSRPSPDGIAGTLATREPHRLVTELDQRISALAAETLPWCATTVIELDSVVGPLLVAHHKPSWPFPAERDRERQALRAARWLEDHLNGRSDGVHVVVLGDFDATPDAASMQFWRGRQSLAGTSVCYQDCWEYAHPYDPDPGYTFDLVNPLARAGEVATAVSRRIDYILVRAGLHGPTLLTQSCCRVFDEAVEGVWASDHFGVLAELGAAADPPDFRTGAGQDRSSDG